MRMCLVTDEWKSREMEKEDMQNLGDVAQDCTPLVLEYCARDQK